MPAVSPSIQWTALKRSASSTASLAASYASSSASGGGEPLSPLLLPSPTSAESVMMPFVIGGDGSSVSAQVPKADGERDAGATPKPNTVFSKAPPSVLLLSTVEDVGISAERNTERRESSAPPSSPSAASGDSLAPFPPPFPFLSHGRLKLFGFVPAASPPLSLPRSKLESLPPSALPSPPPPLFCRLRTSDTSSTPPPATTTSEPRKAVRARNMTVKSGKKK